MIKSVFPFLLLSYMRAARELSVHEIGPLLFPLAAKQNNAFIFNESSKKEREEKHGRAPSHAFINEISG
jgi:hypothetical protein